MSKNKIKSKNSPKLNRKWTSIDKRNEPRSGERVPYVIINGPPGLPLIRLVRSPWEVLHEPTLTPNALYYITKAIIPPINRCLGLIGADVNLWFKQMPIKKQLNYSTHTSSSTKKTIAQYFQSNNCLRCNRQTQGGLCVKCGGEKQETVVVLNDRVRVWEMTHWNTSLVIILKLEFWGFYFLFFFYRYVSLVAVFWKGIRVFHWIVLFYTG